jgi:hypothetical protein
MGTQGSGGARRDRTVDLLHAMQALSQLSYGPIQRGRILRKYAWGVNEATFQVVAAADGGASVARLRYGC